MGSFLVLDEIVSYKKALDFSYTHYYLVIGEDGTDAIRANLVALSAKQELVFIFREH